MNNRGLDTGIRSQYVKILSLGVLLMLSACAFAQTFKAVASAKEVPLNSTFEIIYTIENGGTIKFNPPKFEGFDAYGPSTSQSSVVIDGKLYQKASFIYTLQPKKQGSFILPAATAQVDGKLLKCNAVPVIVTAPVKQQAPTAGAGNNGSYRDPYDDDMGSDADDLAQLDAQIAKNFLVAVVPDKTTIYEGDQVTLAYKVYNTDVQFRNLVATSEPSFDGFLSEELEVDPNAKPGIEVYKGNKYFSKTIRRVALFPVKPGKYAIEPVKLNAVVFVNVRHPYFGYSVEPYSYDFQSNTLQLDVLPLPKPQPANYSGAVGDYSFSANYDKVKVRVNEPLSLRVTFSGTGNIKLIQAPKLDFPEVFEVYPPKVKETYATEGSGVSGVKSFEYTLVPQDGGTYTLPAYEFAYFSPEKKRYITFSLPETRIEVEGRAATSANLKRILKQDGSAAKKRDIYDIAALDGHTTLLYGTPVFWGLGAAPIALLLLGFAFRRRQYDEGELLLLRRRKATRMAMKRLATAKKRMHPNTEKAFYDEVVRALWQYISDKLYIKTSDLSRGNIEQKLLARGVGAEKITGLIAMLDTCEMALFSQQGRAGHMRETYDQAVKWITETDEQLTQTAL